ncbi:MAG: hypothetical protein K0S08_1347 [Gammaproteobacteria bacterium]|jgi:hypothetical protein|nr:hypothetical protein [Gammaproteobacteria bacterium]
MKKFLTITSLFLVLSAQAETCPSVDDVQHNRLGEWRVLNANSGEPLSPAQIIKYENKVRYFAEAAYYKGAPEGPAQCYYDGEGEHYHLETYLARYDLMPVLSRGNWYDRGYGNYDCRHVLVDCQFQKTIMPTAKLANFSSNKAHDFW